jgi:signal transduction histidine kinase
VNACKFTPAGGVIHVSASREDDWAVVRVADNGVGIAPEEQERIFGIFSQAEAGARQPQAGLGIGLALVKGFVELHGGCVAVHSEGRNRGAAFVVRLPLLP